MKISDNRVALITGAARRIGAALARALHGQGFNVIVHYGDSKADAIGLANELNTLRPGSAHCLQASLEKISETVLLAEKAVQVWGRIDLLINNASRFYPTAIGEVTDRLWNDLIQSNLSAPFFLSQALADELKKTSGCIINMVDIYAGRPLKGYPVYSISKAGMAMLTQSLARELGPDVRVNGISPGAILWPDKGDLLNSAEKSGIIERTALKKAGCPEDICQAALFLIDRANYITGQIISVDGGRTVGF